MAIYHIRFYFALFVTIKDMKWYLITPKNSIPVSARMKLYCRSDFREQKESVCDESPSSDRPQKKIGMVCDYYKVSEDRSQPLKLLILLYKKNLNSKNSN